MNRKTNKDENKFVFICVKSHKRIKNHYIEGTINLNILFKQNNYKIF